MHVASTFLTFEEGHPLLDKGPNGWSRSFLHSIRSHCTTTFLPLNRAFCYSNLLLAASGSGSGRDFIPIMSLAVTFFPSADDRQENVVQINVLDDIFVEDDETLSSVVSLTAADDAIDLNPAVANITILNDDSKFVCASPALWGLIFFCCSLYRSQLSIAF